MYGKKDFQNFVSDFTPGLLGGRDKNRPKTAFPIIDHIVSNGIGLQVDLLQVYFVNQKKLGKGKLGKGKFQANLLQMTK